MVCVNETAVVAVGSAGAAALRREPDVAGERAREGLGECGAEARRVVGIVVSRTPSGCNRGPKGIKAGRWSVVVVAHGAQGVVGGKTRAEVGTVGREWNPMGDGRSWE